MIVLKYIGYFIIGILKIMIACLLWISFVPVVPIVLLISIGGQIDCFDNVLDWYAKVGDRIMDA